MFRGTKRVPPSRHQFTSLLALLHKCFIASYMNRVNPLAFLSPRAVTRPAPVPRGIGLMRARWLPGRLPSGAEQERRFLPGNIGSSP